MDNNNNKNSLNVKHEKINNNITPNNNILNINVSKKKLKRDKYKEKHNKTCSTVEVQKVDTKGIFNALFVYYNETFMKEECSISSKYINIIHKTKSEFGTTGNDIYKNLSRLWKKHDLKCFFVIGRTYSDWGLGWANFHFDLASKFIWVSSIKDITEDQLLFLAYHSSYSSKQRVPLVSFFSSTFKSGEKLQRAIQSVKSQTYTNIEWIIFDDSPDDHDETYKQLKVLAKEDMRIKIYRTEHSGNIGEVKRRTASLASGNYLIELDHDDRVTPNLCQNIVDAFKKYPNAGFALTNFIMVNEPYNSPHMFDQGACFGYGWYFKIWSLGRYQLLYQTQGLNPDTIHNIIGVPNHTRIWKKSLYESIGKHNADMVVSDDYELILRTFLSDKDIVCIKPSYYTQYNNEHGNNFTYIRNELIQALFKVAWRYYGEKVMNKFKTLGYGPRNELSAYPTWLKRNFEFPLYEKFYHPEKTLTSIILPFWIDTNRNDIIKTLESIFQLHHTLPDIYLIGHPRSQLNNFANKEMKISIINREYNGAYERVKWWDFLDLNDKIIEFDDCWADDSSYKHHIFNYAIKTAVRTKLVAYINPGTIIDNDWLYNIESNIINNKENSFDSSVTIGRGNVSKKNYNIILNKCNNILLHNTKILRKLDHCWDPEHCDNVSNMHSYLSAAWKKNKTKQ